MTDKFDKSELALHESYDSDETPVIGSDRSFGLVFTAIFALLGAWAVYHDRAWMVWPFVLSGAFLVLALTRPLVLHPLNVAWMAFGRLLHRITQPIILGAMFFLAILPTGLMMRVFGCDPMHRRFEGGPEDSYWIARANAAGDHSMKNQF
tara:strand:- start:55673 stop:56122 length:450 start_codon:yes stop_codon:yes gene_type:complete